MVDSISTSQRIDAINYALSQAVESRKQGNAEGRTYLVIDTKTGMIGTTSDKTQASSMKQVMSTMNELSREIFNDRGDQSLNRDSIKKLRSNFSTFMRQYENKERGFFGKIAHQISSFVNGFFKLDEQINDNLDHRLAAYGLKEQVKKNGETIIKTVAYEKKQPEIVLQRKMAEEGINQLDKIKDAPNLSPLRISKAFGEELNKAFESKWGYEKAASAFVIASFDTLLSDLTDQVENQQLSPEEAAQKFLSQLKDHILKNNEEKLELDRETFRDLVGDWVQDGKGSKRPDSLDMSDPAFKKLVKDYNSGDWKVGEERTLTQKVMNDETLKKMLNALDTTLNNETFEALLTHYFSQISK
jgi:hypothetical protein